MISVTGETSSSQDSDSNRKNASIVDDVNWPPETPDDESSNGLGSGKHESDEELLGDMEKKNDDKKLQLDSFLDF